MPPKIQSKILKSRRERPTYPITPTTTFPKFTFNMRKGIEAPASIITQSELDMLREDLKKTQIRYNTLLCDHITLETTHKKMCKEKDEKIANLENQLSFSEEKKREYLINWRSAETTINSTKRILTEVVNENHTLTRKVQVYELANEVHPEDNLRGKVDDLLTEIQILEEEKEAQLDQAKERRKQTMNETDYVKLYCDMERAAINQRSLQSFLQEMEKSSSDEEKEEEDERDNLTETTCSWHQEVASSGSLPKLFCAEALDDIWKYEMYDDSYWNSN
jgi:hypothetical protein